MIKRSCVVVGYGGGGGGGGGWVVLGCRFSVEDLIFGFLLMDFGFFDLRLIWDLIFLCFGLIFMIGISCVVMGCGDGSWVVVGDLQKCCLV